MYRQDAIREKRLVHEFERMLAICKKDGLIKFFCANLSTEEDIQIQAPSMSKKVVAEALEEFITPEQFMQHFPDQPPEKYLIVFDCIGLKKIPDNKIVETNEHALMVVFGSNYIPDPPRLIWMTPIWHPNIDLPHICTEGRPFSLGTSLDLICLMVGQMIQYRNYNIYNPLNKEAAEWARMNQNRFPIDTRDLLDGQERSRPLVTLIGDTIVEWSDEQPALRDKSESLNDQIVEIL